MMQDIFGRNISRDLDNYIMGVYQHQEEDIALKCPDCNKTWKALLVYDTGAWFYHNDNDAYCPDCGIEGEELLK